jgi:soluble lytic murein transglycosylase-like protein
MKSIMRVESNFQEQAVSQGNYGLMQIRLTTAKHFCNIQNVPTLMNPYNNVDCSCKILSSLNQIYKRVPLVISAYNAGTATSKNRVYVTQVLKYKANYDRRK